LRLRILPAGANLAAPIVEFNMPIEKPLEIAQYGLRISQKKNDEIYIERVDEKPEDLDHVRSFLVDLESAPADARSALNRIKTTRQFDQLGKFARHQFNWEGADSVNVRVSHVDDVFSSDYGAVEFVIRDFEFNR
jgi:hypothetical protein